MDVVAAPQKSGVLRIDMICQKINAPAIHVLLNLSVHLAATIIVNGQLM